MKPKQPVNVFHVSWRILAFLLAVSIGVGGGMAFRCPAPAVQACGECAQTTDTPQWDSYAWLLPKVLHVTDDFTPEEAVAYSTPLSQARTAWNNATNVIYFWSGYGNQQITVEGDDKWDPGVSGETILTVVGTTITAANVKLMNYVLIDDDDHNMHKKNSIGHELGHCLGLDENNTDKGALMYYTCDSYHDCNVSTPQTDDINGVESIY